MSAGLAILYRFICIWQNAQRDRAGTLEGYDHAYEDDVTDRKVSRCSVLTLAFLYCPELY